jgi:hypothetical protein
MDKPVVTDWAAKAAKQGFMTRPPTKNPRYTDNASTIVREKRARVVELRTKGYLFDDIAKETGFSLPYVHKQYRIAMKYIITENVDNLRKLESAKLEGLMRELTEIGERFHPLVQRGQVVMQDLISEDTGLPVLDEEGRIVQVPMEDISVKINIIGKKLNVMERFARLMGLDAPVKTAMTNPDGTKEATASLVLSMTPEQLMEEAQKRGLPTTIFQL